MGEHAITKPSRTASIASTIYAAMLGAPHRKAHPIKRAWNICRPSHVRSLRRRRKRSSSRSRSSNNSRGERQLRSRLQRMLLTLFPLAVTTGQCENKQPPHNPMAGNHAEASINLRACTALLAMVGAKKPRKFEATTLSHEQVNLFYK